MLCCCCCYAAAAVMLLLLYHVLLLPGAPQVTSKCSSRHRCGPAPLWQSCLTRMYPRRQKTSNACAQGKRARASPARSRFITRSEISSAEYSAADGRCQTGCLQVAPGRTTLTRLDSAGLSLFSTFRYQCLFMTLVGRVVLCRPEVDSSAHLQMMQLCLVAAHNRHRVSMPRSFVCMLHSSKISSLCDGQHVAVERRQ